MEEITKTATSKFFQLPTEIRNQVFKDLYEELTISDDNLSDWALKISKVSRNWYNESMPIIVPGLLNSLMVQFDKITQSTRFKITRGNGPREMVRYVKHLRLEIPIEWPSHPDISAQILEIETNLRKLVITLIHTEAKLETLSIEIDEGQEFDRREALNSTHVLELLDNLRELRVTKEVKITGFTNEHTDYLHDIQNSMLLPEASGPSYNDSKIIQSRKNILGICLDFQKYVRICRRIVDSWGEEHTVKKAASLRDLAQIFPQITEDWEQPDPVDILPSGITNDIQKEIPKALARIERFNNSITNERLRRIEKNAPFDQMTDAYNRLYMRKSFLEIKLDQQLTIDDPLFYFLDDPRYKLNPWNARSYENYYELPIEDGMADMVSDNNGE